MNIHLHPDAVDFRTEPASVEIGRCPECGEDTEWEWKRAALPVPALDAEQFGDAVMAALRLRLVHGATDATYTPREVAEMVCHVIEKQFAALREGETRHE